MAGRQQPVGRLACSLPAQPWLPACKHHRRCSCCCCLALLTAAAGPTRCPARRHKHIGKAVCRKAEELGAAPLVVAAHDKGPLEHLFVGSVSK